MPKQTLSLNRPVRQDSLDQFVWDEMIRLLDDPALVKAEIDRRREAARQANPLSKREEELRREQARLEKSIERLINAYQEALQHLRSSTGSLPNFVRKRQLSRPRSNKRRSHLRLAFGLRFASLKGIGSITEAVAVTHP